MPKAIHFLLLEIRIFISLLQESLRSGWNLHKKLARPNLARSQFIFRILTVLVWRNVWSAWIWAISNSDLSHTWLRSDPELAQIRAGPGSDLIQIYESDLAQIWTRSESDVGQILAQIGLRSEPGCGPDVSHIWPRSGSELSQIWVRSGWDLTPTKSGDVISEQSAPCQVLPPIHCVHSELHQLLSICFLPVGHL